MPKDLGVTVLPPTCPTASGAAWLSAAKGKVVIQTIGAGRWSPLAVARGKVDMPYRILVGMWQWLGERVRAARQFIFPIPSDSPEAVRVRVEVDCMQPMPGDSLPVVRVRVELEPTPGRSTVLLPEVKVKVEPPPTTTPSSATVPTVT